jgi:hypothetical protein
MRILSIDVGMKHLAYCLFNIVDGSKLTIEKWDVINLCREENKKICMGKTKTNKTCEKVAKYHKNGKFYCKIHAKNKNFLIPSSNLKKKNLKKLKITGLKKLVNKYKLISDKKKPLKKDFYDMILSHADEKFFNFVDTYNANSFNLITYGRSLKDKFNKILENIEIHCVIVENQIGPLALRMKTLQGMIMQHFIERNCSIIEEISPLNKLKKYLGNKKTTYNERKKMGIEITIKKMEELNGLDVWQEHFSKHKKKDDLADSFLQGLWYIENSKLLVKI